MNDNESITSEANKTDVETGSSLLKSSRCLDDRRSYHSLIVENDDETLLLHTIHQSSNNQQPLMYIKISLES